MKRARLAAGAGASLLGVAVAVHDVLTREEPTSLLAVIGYVGGGAVWCLCWVAVIYYAVKARRAS